MSSLKDGIKVIGLHIDDYENLKNIFAKNYKCVIIKIDEIENSKKLEKYVKC